MDEISEINIESKDKIISSKTKLKGRLVVSPFNFFIEWIKKNIIELCVILFALLYLNIIIKSPYISDDVINSFLARGQLFYSETGVVKLTANIVKGWIAKGRFFPFAFYLYGLFYFVNSLYVYKIMIVISSCICIWLGGRLIQSISGSKNIGIITMIINVLLFQLYTNYHSSLYSFNFFFQLTFIYVVLIIKNFINYMQSGNKFNLITCCLLLIIASMTYELAYPFFIVPFILVLIEKRNIKVALQKSLPINIIALFMVLVIIYIRIDAGSVGYDGISINLDLPLVINTFFKQLFAALPFSNMIISYISTMHTGNNVYWLPLNFKALLSGVKLIDILITVTFIINIFLLSREKTEKVTFKGWVKLLIIAGAFFLFPPFLISMSAKYQKELYYGIGYSCVFFQYFGLAILISCIIVYITKNIKLTSNIFGSFLKIIFCIFSFFFISLNQQYARSHVQHSWSSGGNSRVFVEDAIHDGLFDATNEVDTNVYINPVVPYYNDLYFSSIAKKKVAIVSFEEFSKKYNQSGGNHYIFDYKMKGKEGVATLSLMNGSKVGIDLANVQDVVIKSTYVYIPQSMGSKSVSYLMQSFSSYGELFELKNTIRGRLFKIVINDNIKLNKITNILNYYIKTNENSLVEIPIIPSVINFNFDKTNSLFHAKNISDAGYVSEDKEFIGFLNSETEKTIELGKTFTIEALVKPSEKQASYAGIIGNHPSAGEGFVIQQNGGNNNIFNFAYAIEDKKIGFTSDSFELNANKWNYISIIVDQNIIKVYNNGQLIVSDNIIQSAKVKNTKYPVYIGNWIGKDRPFNGTIDEVKISSRALTSEEIIDKTRQIFEEDKYK